MKKIIATAVLLLTASYCLAQVPKSPLHVAESDIYLGYMLNVADYGSGPNLKLSGYELAYTLTTSPHFALTASAGQTITFSPVRDLWQITGGPKINILTGQWRPYITGQIGFSKQDSNTLHPNDIIQTPATVENAVTLRVGVGVDYQIGEHLYWRIGQWAAQPVLWGRHPSSLFQNFSTGIGFSF